MKDSRLVPRILVLRILGLLFFIVLIISLYIFQNKKDLSLSESSLAAVLTSVGGKIEECPDVDPPKDSIRSHANSPQIDSALESITDTFVSIRDEAIVQIGDSSVIRQKRTQLQQTLKNRKQTFVDRMRTDPEGALSQVLNDEDIQTARSITKNCVEERNFVEGRISMVHIDNFEGGEPKNHYRLETDEKKHITLYPAGGVPSSIPIGSRVKIGGYAVGSEMLFEGGIAAEDLEQNETGISLVTPAAIAAPTERRIAVLTAKFQDQTTPAPSEENAKSLIFTWADEFFKEESYGKVALKGDVFGPVTLPYPGQGCALYADPWAFIKSVFDIADPLVDYSQYSTLVLVVDKSAYSCGIYFASLGATGASMAGYPEMQTDYAFAFTPYGFHEPVAAHELGHTFESPHDNFSYCKSPLLCTVRGDHDVEYGNEYSTMGTSVKKGHFSAANKKSAGFLETSDMLAITQSGRYDIAPLESQNASLPRALEIPRYQESPLYLEYRQPIGRDAVFSSWYPASSDIFAGALLTNSNFLIDPTPTPKPNNRFSALKIGDVFIDPVNGTKISVVAKDATKLTADIQLGPVGDIYVKITSPRASGGVKPQFTNPKTINVTVDATAPIGNIKRVEFAIDSKQNVIASDSSAPYERNINVKKLSAGGHSIIATAYDEFGYSRSNTVRIDIRR